MIPNEHPRLDDVILNYAETSPDKPAIRFQNRVISYAELNQRVNALSLYLYAAGVKPGKFVAVMLDPSEDIIVSMLSIFRVGAIYAPLDPEHPDIQIKERLDTIIPTVLITQSHYQSRANDFNVATIYIDGMSATEVHETTRLDGLPDDPACIFFTSGSTGKAKGVLGSYKSLSASIIEPSSALGITSADTVDSIARYAWSISMLELMSALVQGGTTLILERQKALDLNWLAQQASQCTAFHCPPALLKNLSEHIEQMTDQSAFSNIQLVWYGGDVFSRQSIDRLHRVFPNARVATAYGTTEIFGLSHCYFYHRTQADEKVLIGKPVGAMEQLLLKPDRMPAETGEPGELYLGGSRIAMEYYQQPELTTEKFPVINGRRYFYTGDFASMDESGNLQYLQRTDSQVKIRGIRIDLGEIDYHLNAHERVKEAAVIAKEDDHGDKTLHGFVVFHNPDTDNLKTIREHLLAVLPDYMVPTSLTELEHLPYTENFKIDRKALTGHQTEPVSSPQSFKDPLTSQLAFYWQQTAHISPASDQDHFFEIGGNSMSAIVLASTLSRDFNISVEVADIYRAPTLAGQSHLINELNQTAASTITNELHGCLAQVGLFFRELLEHRDASITCTRYITRPAGFDDDLLKKALAMLIERYRTLRTSVTPAAGHLKLTFMDPPDESDMIVNRIPGIWSLQDQRDIPTVAKQTFKFNLRKGPLIAASCCQLDSGEELLQLTVHHIAADDNSTGRLAEDLIRIYDALLNNRAMVLQPLRSVYDDYLAEQQKRLDSGQYDKPARDIAQKLLQQLDDNEANPLIKTDNHLTTPLFDIASLKSGMAGSYSFTDVVAAMSWAFYHQFGRNRFVFCAHVALRRDTEDNPQVGMFVNLLPVFLSVNPEHNERRHAEQTRHEFEQAMGNSDVPYELILRSQEKLRRLGRYPFDGFVNELRFEDEYPNGYNNVVVQRAFATDGHEISMSLIRSPDGDAIKLESPAFDDGQNILHQLNLLISHYLTKLME
ncbi:AMP-binding protein [Gynuella sp.]|uniref:AMP-binding protein n=1 Tax=Gynuella sp. TaxID=2969146 RepID=UPI003D0FD06C